MIQAPRAPQKPARKGIWGSPIAAPPADVQAFRAQFRGSRKNIFTGWPHFIAINLLAVLGTTPAICFVRHAAWWEWAAIPIGFLAANFVEWLAHRYPMHHPMKPPTTCPRTAGWGACPAWRPCGGITPTTTTAT